MTTFLTFIGIIALYILGKIFYDNFFSYRTERNRNHLKQSYSESVARIKRNKELDFNTKSKSRDQDKRDSLLRVAENTGCSIDQVKENFIKGLGEQQLTAAQTKEAIQICREYKYEESTVFNIDPEDTASAYMEEWTKEYFENKEYEYKKRTEREVTEDLMIENPEFNHVVNSGDISKIEDFLGDNPDLIISHMESLMYADAPAEKYRKKAIEKFYDYKDYTGAIQLINKGLEFDEPETEPYLFSLRSKCAKKLLNYNDSLNDMDKAIESILKNFPEDYFSIGDLLKERGKIKQELGDTAGANQDAKKADEYHAKYEANKTDDDDDYELQI